MTTTIQEKPVTLTPDTAAKAQLYEAASKALSIWEALYPEDGRPRRAVEALSLDGYLNAPFAWAAMLGACESVASMVNLDLAAAAAARACAAAAFGRWVELMMLVPDSVRQDSYRNLPRGLPEGHETMLRNAVAHQFRAEADCDYATERLSRAGLPADLWTHVQRISDAECVTMAFECAVGEAQYAEKSFQQGDDAAPPVLTGLMFRCPVGTNLRNSAPRDMERRFAKVHGRQPDGSALLEEWLTPGVLPDYLWVMAVEHVLPPEGDPRRDACMVAVARWLHREAVRAMPALEEYAGRALPGLRKILDEIETFLNLSLEKRAFSPIPGTVPESWHIKGHGDDVFYYSAPLGGQLAVSAIKRLTFACLGFQGDIKRRDRDVLHNAHEYEAYAMWQPMVDPDAERASKIELYHDLQRILTP